MLSRPTKEFPDIIIFVLLNPQKKQKLAEYRNSSSHTVALTTLNQANEALNNTPNEPLNLVIKPPEPLNLVTRSSLDFNLSPSSSNSDVSDTSACKNKKAIKKTFAKVSSKSGLAQWRLKKKKCGKEKSMSSRSKFDLRDRLNRKPFKKIQTNRNKESNGTESTNDTVGLSIRTSEKPKDTKIKLIKVGGSYKIASNKERQHRSEVDDDNLIIDERPQNEQKDIHEKEDEREIDRRSKERKAGCERKPNESALINPNDGSNTTVTDDRRNSMPKTSSLQHVQLVTVKKGKVQDDVTVERKPIWIQIPTNSGGAKIVPLVVPQKSSQQTVSSATHQRQSHVKQMKGPMKSSSNYRDKSGFPRVTEFNKTRKVFKIGEDGTISCLGTLEEVEKTGLLSNKAATREIADKKIDNKNLQTPTNPQLKKTRMDKKTAPEKATSVHKRKGADNLGALDLSVKKSKHFGANFNVPGEENMPVVPVTKSSLVPLQQTVVFTNSIQNQTNDAVLCKVQSKTTKENTEDDDIRKREDRRKKRWEIKNKMKESYFANESIGPSTEQVDLGLRAPYRENMRPNFTFQAPLLPLATIPKDQALNCVQMPSLYYPVRWQTEHPYQGNLFLYYWLIWHELSVVCCCRRCLDIHSCIKCP